MIETGDRLGSSWFSISRDNLENTVSLGHTYCYPRSPLLLRKTSRWHHNICLFWEKQEISNWLLSEIKRQIWKIILPSVGFEHTTPRSLVQCSTNWAIGSIFIQSLNISKFWQVFAIMVTICARTEECTLFSEI